MKNNKKRILRIDSKGRISIPSDIRRSFGLDEGMEVELVFDLSKNYLILGFSKEVDLDER
ncbi:MAG: AbrB/MazE/SpoVT family DNA-binding domain-containing protein [Candidatus Aenigmarchaeota archaeon]|nr:AbrB/MazE/SpoVT family DNA-binding domain-containing protein [Candidatus Aenigmarchaeota archaeon]